MISVLEWIACLEWIALGVYVIVKFRKLNKRLDEALDDIKR